MAVTPYSETIIGHRRQGTNWRLPLPVPFLATMVILAAGGLLTPNPLLSAAAVALLAVLILLTWRPGEPPILVLAVGFQWLQVAMKIIHADIRGVPIGELNTYGGHLEAAIWLSMASLLALGVGIRVALQGMPSAGMHAARREAMLLSAQRIFVAYLAFAALALVARSLAWTYPQLTQILLKVGELKWVFFFLLAYVCFTKRKGYPFLVLAFLSEVIAGFSGFFGGFKTVFLVLIVAYGTATVRWRPRRLLVLGGIVAALFAMGLVWTAVKVDYRDYVNQGQRDQVIRVDLEDRYARLLSLVGGLEQTDLREALTDLADRIAYVDYFSRVLVVVPGVLPHENGGLWLDALVHILTPRVLFPDKAPRPLDTDVTAKYTGMSFKAAGRGTSISMGYVAETYIDFGAPLMLVPLFLLGLLWGWIYRVLLSARRSLLVVNYGLTISVLLPLYQFEINNVKLLGGVIMSFIVAVLIQRFALPRIGPLLAVRRRRPVPLTAQ